MEQTIEELQEENERLRAKLHTQQVQRLADENAKLLAELAKGDSDNEIVGGMSRPKSMKIIEVVHQPDPKTGIPVKTTIRQDMGVDNTQVFKGRQP
jgi:hypothetical protein